MARLYMHACSICEITKSDMPKWQIMSSWAARGCQMRGFAIIAQVLRSQAFGYVNTGDYNVSYLSCSTPKGITTGEYQTTVFNKHLNRYCVVMLKWDIYTTPFKRVLSHQLIQW
jgi:hypothetical protein